ncbi:MAG: 50S ribosomal protein L5 [Candidatus Omnitrophica bacterium]|nr:50S ribosomal protein L5 [Candidatus Omnitrophota bacterium]
MSRLKEKYFKQIVPEYIQKHGLTNRFQVPQLKKIVLNVALSHTDQDAKTLENIQKSVAMITGQKPVLRKARISVANFKLRKGMINGIMVTLRSERMYEFLDRLINVAIPRLRDFRGLSDKSFDKAGNYSFGLREQVIFPEIDPDKIPVSHGMDITIVTSAGDPKKAYEILGMFGFPFVKRQSK